MRKSGLIWGVAVVVIGLLLLLDNLGAFRGISVWSLLWPIVLIGLGVSVLWGALLRPRSAEMEHVTIPLEGASRARIQLKHGAGRLDLHGGADAGILLDGAFGAGLDYSSEREGDTLKVQLRGPKADPSTWAVPWAWGPRGIMDWSISLNGEVPLAFKGEMGANEARLDLSQLHVTDLQLSTGAGATTLTMPAQAGFTRAEVKTGLGSMNIRIPEGVAAHIRVQAGLAGVHIDTQRFPRVAVNTYESLESDQATNKLELRVEVGLGALDVR